MPKMKLTTGRCIAEHDLHDSFDAKSLFHKMQNATTNNFGLLVELANGKVIMIGKDVLLNSVIEFLP